MSPESSPTPEAWVDTAALLTQARAFEGKGAVREAEAAYDAVVVAATRQGDQAALAQACRRRALLAHQAGDSARARGGLQQSYAAAMLLGDRRLAAETLNTLGGLELETRNLAAAEAALEEAAELAGDDAAVLARVSQNLGIVANIRGDHAGADAHYRCSLAAYEARGDAHGSAIARHNLGMLAADRGEHLQASAHYDACERLAESSGDRHLRALCLVNHAEVMLALGRTPEARAALEAADRTFAALEAHFDEPDVQRVLGLCDQADGLLGQAESRLVRARELARMTDARLTEAEAERDLGRLYAQTGRPAQARSAFREAVLAFEGLGATSEAAATRRELALLDVASSGPTAS
jgi:tetratricopeptide (TPR) repeat protein